MAPKRSDGDAKRRRSVAVPAAKRARVDASKASKTKEQCLKEVEEAIDNLDDVSETGREMLRMMVNGSLVVLPEERHTYQTKAAKMVQEALQGVEHGLRTSQAAAEKEVDNCQSIIQAKSQELRSSKQAFSSRVAGLSAGKDAWLVDNRALQSSRRALDAAKEELRICRAKLREVVGCKDELEAAVEKHMPAVISGSAASLQHHVDALIPLLAQVNLVSDASLREAATTALKLAPEARGVFDKWALEQLSAALAKLLEEVPAAEAEHAAVKAAEAAVEAAESSFSEARAQQERSSYALWDAEIELQRSEGLKGEAFEALHEAEEAFGDADRHRQASDKQLAEFREGPIAAFEALLNPASSRCSGPPEKAPAVPQAEEVPAAVKDAADTADKLGGLAEDGSSLQTPCKDSADLADRVPTPVRSAAAER